MAYSKAQANSARAPVLTGDQQIAANVSSTNTLVEIEMTSPCSQISVQASGNLVFTWAVSINGENWTTPVSVSSNTISTYNTSMATNVQVNWTSGSGNVSIVGA